MYLLDQPLVNDPDGLEHENGMISVSPEPTPVLLPAAAHGAVHH